MHRFLCLFRTKERTENCVNCERFEMHGYMGSKGQVKRNKLSDHDHAKGTIARL